MKMRINWFNKEPEIREVPENTNALTFVRQLREETKENYWLEFYHKGRGWINGNLHNLTVDK